MKAKEFFDKLPADDYIFFLSNHEFNDRLYLRRRVGNEDDTDYDRYAFVDQYDNDILVIHIDDEVSIDPVLGRLCFVEKSIINYYYLITIAKRINLNEVIK